MSPTYSVGEYRPATDNPLVLTALNEILLALTHAQTRNEVLQIIAEKACLLLNCNSAAVALLEADRETIYFAAAVGNEAQDITGTRVRTSDTVVGNTARTGETYVAFRTPLALRDSEVQNPSSIAVIPIFAGGQSIGTLAALSKLGNKPFSGDDVMILSTLATAASVAINSDQLRHEAERQGRELAVLYDAARNISGRSVQEVLRAVVGQVSLHTNSGSVVVLLANDERTHLYVAEDQGLDEESREITLPANTGLGRTVLSATRPVFLTFAEEDEKSPYALSYEPPFPMLRSRSALATPIRSRDTTHGIVIAMSPQTADAYTLADANLLSALATQAGMAIESAWLYEDANRRAEEGAALYELSQAVTSTLRLPDVLDRVAGWVLRLLTVDKFALFLSEKNSLKLVVSRGLSPGAADRLRPLIGQGIPGWVMEFETPAAVQDVAADQRNKSAPLHGEGVVSMMCMPLQAGIDSIGVLCAMHSRRRLFTVAEVELLYTIANQAAIAIQNARIYDDVRRKSRELRRYFHRVARALGSSQSPKEVPNLIATLTMEVMGADRCALYAMRQAGKGNTSGTMALEIEASAGFKKNELETGEETPSFWIARHARALTLENIAADDRFSEKYKKSVRKMTSYLGVPLREGRRVIGVLEIYTRTQHEWRNEEIRLLLTFASQAIVAFQNARLVEESRQAARGTQILQHLLTLSLQNAPLSGERIIAVLAEQLNRPTALLRRVSKNASWTIGSISDDRFNPFIEVILRTAELGGSETENRFTLLISGDEQVALVVLRQEGKEDDPTPEEIRSLLKAAIRLVARDSLTLPTRKQSG